MTASETRAYSAPPIIEAVVQLVFADTLSAAKLSKLGRQFGREYPHQQATKHIGAKINFELQQTEFLEEPQTRLSSTDEADVLIVAGNTLTWSRLAPYPGWDSFLSRVRRDFLVAHASTGFRTITRIGVRYINRLDVPRVENIVRYEDFLAINLELPEELEPINNYAWRIERNFPELGYQTIVQSLIAEPEVPDCGAFILDIDVYRDHDLPAKMEDIFLRLDDMRALKNRLFELCIKDKARKEFQ